MHSIIVGVLCLVIGLLVGNIATKESARGEVANECRNAGAFTNKRTGFECRPIKKVAQ